MNKHDEALVAHIEEWVSPNVQVVFDSKNPMNNDGKGYLYDKNRYVYFSYVANGRINFLYPKQVGNRFGFLRFNKIKPNENVCIKQGPILDRVRHVAENGNSNNVEDLQKLHRKLDKIFEKNKKTESKNVITTDEQRI